jgi:hypothetical protein
MRTKIQLRAQNVLSRSALMHDSESKGLRNQVMKREETSEVRSMRALLGVTLRNEARIRTRERLETENIVT